MDSIELPVRRSVAMRIINIEQLEDRTKRISPQHNFTHSLLPIFPYQIPIGKYSLWQIFCTISYSPYIHLFIWKSALHQTYVHVNTGPELSTVDNKKAQLTQRERATAVHVWRPTANKCKIRKNLYFSAQGHSRSLLSVSIETRVWLPISD